MASHRRHDLRNAAEAIFYFSKVSQKVSCLYSEKSNMSFRQQSPPASCKLANAMTQSGSSETRVSADMPQDSVLFALCSCKSAT